MRPTILPAALFAIALFVAAGCSDPSSDGASREHGDGSHLEDYELAPLMGLLQRHSEKLGYSIAAGNRPLATFYVEELEETLEEIEGIHSHDGMPIGKPAEVIMSAPVVEVARSVADEEWGSAWSAYEALIAACNRCHAATEHAFIEILPARGTPAYNQRFRP